MTQLPRELTVECAIMLERRARNNGDWPEGEAKPPDCFWRVLDLYPTLRGDRMWFAHVERIVEHAIVHLVATELGGMPPRVDQTG